MANRIDEIAIKYGDRDVGTTIKLALEDIDVLIGELALAGEAYDLFHMLLERFQTARDVLVAFMGDSNSLRHGTNIFTELVTRFSGLVHSYCNDSLAGRVVQHKKLLKKLEELNGKNYDGLDQVYRLVNGPRNVDMSWREPFKELVKRYEAALAAKVTEEITKEKLKDHPEIAEESETMLQYAAASKDHALWNDLAKAFRDKLSLSRDSSSQKSKSEEAMSPLPEWFLAISTIAYSRRWIKKGSFGSIHYGTWASGTKIVVKVLIAKGMDKSASRLSADDQAAFTTEADLWYKMSHPYVLRLFGACHNTLPPFFVCEQAPQGDLKDVLAISKSKIWRLLFETALAIEYLHCKDVVHGDLKLNNVLVAADGYARLADFGLSRFKKRTTDNSMTAQTVDVQSAGALRWRAPECVRKFKPRQASDVYSFGMCVFEAFAGETPYGDLRDDVIETKIEAGELPERPEHMPENVYELVKWIAVKDLNARPSIEEIANRLRKSAYDELEAEMQATNVCPRCQHRVDSNNVCSRCNMSVTPTRMLITPESLVIKSKEDLPRVIELLTLGTDEHKKFASSALREYLFGKPEHQIEVYDAGAVPILTKLLKDTPLAQGTDNDVVIDALLTLGCTTVGNKKNQKSAVFENAIPLVMNTLNVGADKTKIKSVLNIAYLAHGNPEIRKQIMVNEENRYIAESIAALKTSSSNSDVQAAADRAEMFLNPVPGPAA